MRITVETMVHIGEEVITQINDHCERGIPFIIYDDKEHYMRVYPMQRRIRLYVNGECETEEQFNGDTELAVRIQTGLLVYKNFFSLADEVPQVHKKVNEEAKLIEQPSEETEQYEED